MTRLTFELAPKRSLLDTPPETIRELAAHWYALVFPTGSRQYQYDIERVSLCVTNYWPA